MPLASGTRLGPYELRAPIGAGGMGEVYRAEDVRLGRAVAVKFLSEGLSADDKAIERFEREAGAASRLNHPNVCAVYDVGEHEGRRFIVMELLDGTTLHEHIGGRPLPVERILDVGVQVADALAAAHALGIVHRDVKPANLFVTARGSVKLLDFGLAKPARADLRVGASDSMVETAKAVTGRSAVLGTLAYMSPEQVRGEPLDPRTDVFSTGAVLYEMATGRQAFAGPTAGTVYDAVLNRAPADPKSLNPALPPRLLEIIARALEKDPGLRYQHAVDLRADLLRLQRDLASTAAPAPARDSGRRPWRRQVLGTLFAGAVGVVAVVAALFRFGALPWRGQPIDSVAVLPFVNASGTADTEYLSDGITESLIRDLSEVPSLKVSARGRVFRYKGREMDPQAVGRELAVRAVLSGRLLHREGAFIIRAELMDVSDGSQLWGGEYTSSTTNVFELQSYLSRQISQGLRLRLTSTQRQRLTTPRTVDNEAYRLYLQGQYAWNKRSPEGALQAIEHLNAAVKKDPGYALAYAALGDAYNFASFLDVFRPRDAMPKSKAAAARALEIDPNLAEAHISLGWAAFTFDWDWAAATRHFEQARALNVHVVENHPYYAFYLSVAKRPADAIRAAERSLAADPVSPAASHNLAVQLALAGRLDDAIEECRRTLALDSRFAIAYQVMAAVYAAKGEYEAGRTAAEQAVALDGATPLSLAVLGNVHARSGARQEALRVVERLVQTSGRRYVPSLALAMVYAGLGDKDRAFAALDKACEERFNRLAYLRLEPVWDGLRSDPRFDTLLRRIGLPR